MSSMLEQAIIDAAALREAALKNAEQSLIEKYAPQIKEAVEVMLENSGKRMKYENRIVNVVHESDSQGNVTVSEADGKPFVVNEAELSEINASDLLHEEEMALGGTAGAPDSGGIEAPFAGNPNVQSSEVVNLDVDVEAFDDEVIINLKDLEQQLSGMNIPSDDFNSIEDMAGELTGEEEILGDEDATEEEEDLQLQELLDLLSEEETNTLEEKIGAGGPEGGARKAGWVTTAAFQNEEQQDYQEVADNLYSEEEEDEDEDDETDESGIPVAQKQLEESINLLKSQNEKLETIVYKLNDKLEETLLSNAKLIYQNRTLSDASLNERQKDKIVEAIAKAESPKEAKHLHETLRTTVGSPSTKAPKSLNETVNRKSNLSGMLNRRQNLNESQTSDPFFSKMKKLAGIK